MVNPVGHQGPPAVTPHGPKASPAPVEVAPEDGATGAAPSEDAGAVATQGKRHAGPPGQLAKEMLGGSRPPGFSLGSLVSLLAQGRDEEAEALVAGLVDDTPADDGAEASGDETAGLPGETPAAGEEQSVDVTIDAADQPAGDLPTDPEGTTGEADAGLLEGETEESQSAPTSPAIAEAEGEAALLDLLESEAEADPPSLDLQA